MVKYTVEQQDEELHRVTSGSVLSIGASAPMKFGVCRPLDT